MDTIGDPTDPVGTKRPKAPPIVKSFTHFDRAKLNRLYKPIVNLPPEQANNAYTIFTHFFSDSILETIVKHTNACGALGPNRIRQEDDEPTIVLNDISQPWRDTTIGELRAFLAIHIYMEEHHERDLLSYWAKNEWDPSHNRIHKTMSRNRFMQLQRYFQISDPNKRPMGPFDRVSMTR